MTVSLGIPQVTGPGLQALSGADFLFTRLSCKSYRDPRGLQNTTCDPPFQRLNRLPLPRRSHARVGADVGRGARPQGRPREGCDIRPHASRGRSLTVREGTRINRTASRGRREVMMLTREVLVIVPVSDDALNRIAAVDRS